MTQSRAYNLDIPEWFWQLIEEAQQDSARMEALLERLPPEQVREFCGHFEEAVLELYPERTIPERKWDWDTIEDVSVCVVAQGKRKYLEVWEHPERFPAYEEFPYRNYGIVADEVYERKTGQRLYLP
jgi:hypothetical protein